MMQERNNYCLCSVLSDIFLDYDIRMSQKDIARNLTPSEKGFKGDDNKIRNFLREKGFDYNFYWWNQTPFNEPDSLLIEISENNGFVAFGDHAVRVLEFDDPKVVVLDPASCNESPTDLDYNFLISRLRESDGGFGLLKYIH
jgi:hypothetical protein